MSVSKDAVPRLTGETVRAAYKVWAPFYDYSFGVVATPGRHLAVSMLNKEQGRILEIGVGTGLSLPRYLPHLQVTGIDLSTEMLDKAAARIRSKGLRKKTLSVMDAGRLAFASSSFEAVAAMHVMTVVPDPEQVMSEIARVLKPGGVAIILNHFSREDGLRGRAERALARFSTRLGWHPIFPIDTVLGASGFKLEKQIELPPGGLFTLLQLRKAL